MMKPDMEFNFADEKSSDSEEDDLQQHLVFESIEDKLNQVAHENLSNDLSY